MLAPLVLLTLAALSAFTVPTNASPAPLALLDTRNQATCPTCNPNPLYNKCDITTSCISTGTYAYCACRAGYKAANLKHENPNIEFRLTGTAYENRVFVPTGQPCDTLCDNPYAGPGPNGACTEVILTTCKDT